MSIGRLILRRVLAFLLGLVGLWVGLLAFLLPLLLALAGLAAAIFSIQSGTAALSLPSLADLIGLPGLRESVGTFLSRLEAAGPLALLALAAGLAAIALGVLMLVALFSSGLDREVALQRGDREVAIRRRTLGRLSEILAEDKGGIVSARAKVRSRLLRGDRLRLELEPSRQMDSGRVRGKVDDALGDIARSETYATKLAVREPARGGAE